MSKLPQELELLDVGAALSINAWDKKHSIVRVSDQSGCAEFWLTRTSAIELRNWLNNYLEDSNE
jgi:hypothetical protein